jgi:hypothetical protein
MGSMPGSVKSKIIKWVFVVSPLSTHQDQGRIQDFKLGEAHLKKLRRAEGGANIFGVFRVNINGAYLHALSYISINILL